jgi:uncharacterized repeat protein (TIGR02543 family)
MNNDVKTSTALSRVHDIRQHGKSPRNGLCYEEGKLALASVGAKRAKMACLSFFIFIFTFFFCIAACELGGPAQPPSYTVVYDANGGSGNMDNSTHIYGKGLNLNANTFSFEDYDFIGWAESPQGAVKYKDKQSVKNLTKKNGTRVTLYAVWTPTQYTQDQYTVTFNINGGSGTTPDARTVYAGSSITLPDGSGLTKSGYTFDGWNTNDSGTGTNYGGGSAFTATGDVELYAKWVTLVPGSSLAEKLVWLQTNALSNVNYTVEVNADEDIDPTSLNYNPRTNIGVTLVSTGAERIIGLSSTGCLFIVSNGVTLTLDNNITLQGRSDNNASLVYVNNGGTFTMNGGVISGNTAAFGGGVYVGGGIFRIVTGTIYGSNETDTDLRNTATSSGAALSLFEESTAEFGTFSGEEWNRNGTLGTTDDTIRVVNGILQQ